MPPAVTDRHAATDLALDRADYEAFLLETGLSADWIAAVSSETRDQIPMPYGWCVQVLPSPIHGSGLFATHNIAPGEIVAPARRGAKRTPAGRYANHAARPNTCAVPGWGDPHADLDLVALRPIRPGEEITLDYRACAAYRPPPAPSRHFALVQRGLDVAPLRAALARQPELFGVHGARGGYGSPHAAMTDIWVRYNAIEHLGPHFNDEHDPVWYPAWAALPELAPLVFGLMHTVRGERLGGVLITKLPPGGEIALHVDRGWHADYYEKFYIAVATPPGARFRFPDGDIVATDGDCYWFDNSVPHGVENGGATERLALIVCIRTALYAHPGGRIA